MLFNIMPISQDTNAIASILRNHETQVSIMTIKRGLKLLPICQLHVCISALCSFIVEVFNIKLYHAYINWQLDLSYKFGVRYKYWNMY